MLPTTPAAATQAVLWGGLLIGLLLGIAGQATRFCVRGAIADWVIFRGPARFAAWMLAIGVGAVGVQMLIATGNLDATRTIAWSPRLLWVSALAGGLLFGYGMVLAAGCPQRSLVKAGQGSMRSVVTVIVVAITALMTLRGLFAPLRVGVFDAFAVTLATPGDVGAIAGTAFGVSAQALRWTLAALLLAGAAALAWRLRAVLDRGTVIGGLTVGLLLTAALFLTGRVGFLAEHPETLEAAWLGTQSKRPEGLSFSAPLAHGLDLLTLWTDKGTLASFGVLVALGVIAGSFASALWRREFRLEVFATPREFGEYVLGGVLMGFGGVTALGCSIGNGVTGAALLGVGSLLATLGISAGAWLALTRQVKRLSAAGDAVPATAA